MRHLGWTVVAVASFLAMSSAQAGVTCKMVASMCPTDGSQQTSKEQAAPNGSVPEPASLVLLGAGVSAVGAAVSRRRKDK